MPRRATQRHCHRRPSGSLLHLQAPISPVDCQMHSETTMRHVRLWTSSHAGRSLSSALAVATSVEGSTSPPHPDNNPVSSNPRMMNVFMVPPYVGRLEGPIC